MQRFCSSLFFLFLILIIIPACVLSQINTADTIPEFKTVIAGKEYKASHFKEWLWGSNYRNVWTTPVTFKVLDLDTSKGGLKPVNTNNRDAAKTLYLSTMENEAFTLRSVNKMPGKLLPEAFRRTVAEDRVNDEVSMSNPYAPATLSYLAERSNIYYANPVYNYLPKQPALSNYNDEYGNDLYQFEQTLTSKGNNADNLVNFEKFIDTHALLDLLKSNNNIIVDEQAYIRARLFDMLINDWNRPEEKWQWGEKRTGDKIIYVPFPQNYDEAYSKHDGLLSGAVLKALGNYKQSFHNNLQNVNYFNYKEKDPDRLFTIEATLDVWQGTARDLQHALTDSVIETAIQHLPKEIYPLVGNDIVEKLKARRSHLVEWATEYYKFLSKEVEIPGSYRNEEFDVRQINRNELLIRVFNLNDQNKKNDTPFYSRIFKSSETKEVRLFGLVGNDKYVFSENSGNPIKIKVIDGINKDSVIDVSSSNDKIDNVKIYGDNDSTRTNAVQLYISEDTLFRSYNYNWYKYDKKGVVPLLFYSNEDRIFIGLIYRMTHYRWGKKPFASTQTLGLHYSLMEKAPSLTYRSMFPNIIKHSSLGILANYDDIRWVYFFGLGNETQFSKDYNLKYYTMRTRQWIFQPIITKAFKRGALSVYGDLEGIKIINDTSRYIAKTPANTTGFEWQTYAGGGISYNYHRLDNVIVPVRGVYFNATASGEKNLQTSSSYYFKYSGVAHFYIPLVSKFSLNIRTGASTVTGHPEFYQYPSIGGPTFRGTVRDRFRGKSAFYNTNDIRYISNWHTYFFSGKAGFLAFVDDGRVWMPYENSNTWHIAYGAGIILAPLNYIYADFTYGRSNNEGSLQVRVTLPIP